MKFFFQRYRLSRGSRFNDFFDEPDGDFVWLDLNIDEDGEQFHEVEVPETPDDFGIFAFSWSKENGIGLTQTSYSTVRPIDFYCEIPDEIRRGECVGKFIFVFYVYYFFFWFTLN